MSAGTMPLLTPAGQGSDCQPKRNGNARPGADSIRRAIPGVMTWCPRENIAAISGRGSFRIATAAMTGILPPHRRRVFAPTSSASTIRPAMSGNGSRIGFPQTGIAALQWRIQRGQIEELPASSGVDLFSATNRIVIDTGSGLELEIRPIRRLVTPAFAAPFNRFLQLFSTIGVKIAYVRRY